MAIFGGIAFYMCAEVVIFSFFALVVGVQSIEKKYFRKYLIFRGLEGRLKKVTFFCLKNLQK